MKIYRTVNPVAYENTYYLENEHSLILVDPGSDWATIQKQIDRIGKPIVAILLTHTHYDHIMSLEKVVRPIISHLFMSIQQKPVGCLLLSIIYLVWIVMRI